MNLINKIYQKYSKGKYKEIPFIIFITFFFTFIIARVSVVFIIPQLHLFIKGYHIHHFYYGVILLIISNWVSILKQEEKWHRLSAILFGSGLGLMADEIGLMLTCGTALMDCDYHTRITFDIIIIIFLLLLNIIYFLPFWKAIIKPIMNPKITIEKIIKKLLK